MPEALWSMGSSTSSNLVLGDQSRDSGDGPVQSPPPPHRAPPSSWENGGTESTDLSMTAWGQQRGLARPPPPPLPAQSFPISLCLMLIFIHSSSPAPILRGHGLGSWASVCLQVSLSKEGQSSLAAAPSVSQAWLQGQLGQLSGTGLPDLPANLYRLCLLVHQYVAKKRNIYRVAGRL